MARLYGFVYLSLHLIFDSHFRRGYLHAKNGGTLANDNSSPAWDLHCRWQRGFDIGSALKGK